MNLHHGKNSHYTLCVLTLVYMMSFIDRQIISILIEPIKREFKITDTEIGLLTGIIFSLFYAGLAVPFARYADRANRRNFIAYCCAAWSTMTILCGMATGYASLALTRIGLAIGEAGATAPSLSMVADLYPPAKRGRAMSIFWLGPQLGMLVGLTTAGWIAHEYGWRTAFIAVGIPGIILALLLRFTTDEPARGQWEAVKPPPTTEPFKAVLKDLLCSKVFMLLSAVGLLMGFAGYGIGIWTPSFLMRSHGMTLTTAAATMGLAGGIMAVLGTLASGWLCDKLAKRNPRWRLGVPAIGCLLAVPTGGAFFLIDTGGSWSVQGFNIPHEVGFFMLFSLTAASWTAPINSVLPDIIPPHRRATAIAIFNLGLTLIGAGLGPLFVGFLSDTFHAVHGPEGLRIALAISTVACYTTASVMLLLAASKLKTQNSQQTSIHS